MQYRPELIQIFNHAKFSLRHYAKGNLNIAPGKPSSMSVNRLFIPIADSGTRINYIAEKEKKHILKVGFLYFVPAFLPVEFCLDETLYFLSIHNNFEIFPGVELFSSCPRMTVIKTPPQTERLLHLMETKEDEKFLASFQLGSLVLALQESLLPFYNPEDFHTPLALQHYAPLAKYLEENGSGRTTVKVLAEFSNQSRENFSRNFSRTTGITPKEFIDRYVTRKAVELLKNGHSIKETAHILKFRDEFLFSRYFKRNLGTAPSRFLKENKKILHP